MNDQERELDLMVAELEQENRLLRARNDRLEAEQHLQDLHDENVRLGLYEQEQGAEHVGEPVDWSDEQLKMLNFLYGAGDFDGVWFEQKHPTEKGVFWWRKHMKRLFDYNLKE